MAIKQLELGDEYLRTPDIYSTRTKRGLLPVGRSCFLKGVKEGRFPQPIYLGTKLPVWRRRDIEEILKG